MANQEHIEILKRGPESWNRWRKDNFIGMVNLDAIDLSEAQLPGVDFNKVSLQGAFLKNADLAESDLRFANLADAQLQGATLTRADLRGANLRGAKLAGARLEEAHLVPMLPGHVTDLTRADLTDVSLTDAHLQGVILDSAILRRAHLFGAHLRSAQLKEARLQGATLVNAELQHANLAGADLTGADLSEAILVETDLTNATLTGCVVYGMAAWGLKLAGAKSQDLRITPPGEASVTVDNLEVAQFMYLMLRNEKIRDVIDTVGRKCVLLLGRFTGGRIHVLERLQGELRKRGFVPVVFNFDKPDTRDFTDTVRVLAGLSHFVIADITNPRSAPLELQATVPECMVPFVPILEQGEEPFAMLRDLWIKHRDWVLEPIRYSSLDRLIAVLDVEIVKPAQERFAALVARKAETLKVKDV